MRGLFVTGTGTSVGKTYVSALILRSLLRAGVKVGAYKPACSGAEPNTTPPVWSDVEILSDCLKHQFSRSQICPQTFLAPLAPPHAAAAEGREVDRNLLRTGAEKWTSDVDFLLVEGAGGFYSPISNDDLVADLAVDLGFPVLVVASPGLGTINSTLLTLEAIQSRKLRSAGVIFSQQTPADGDGLWQANAQAITQWSGQTVLGLVPAGSSDLLQPAGPVTIDWTTLFELAQTSLAH